MRERCCSAAPCLMPMLKAFMLDHLNQPLASAMHRCTAVAKARSCCTLPPPQDAAPCWYSSRPQPVLGRCGCCCQTCAGARRGRPGAWALGLDLLAACRLRRHQQEEEQLAPAEDEEEEEDEEESEYETDSEEEGFGRALLKPVFVPKVTPPRCRPASEGMLVLHVGCTTRLVVYEWRVSLRRHA